MAIRQSFILGMINKLSDTFGRIFVGGSVEDEESTLYEIEGALAEVFRTRRELLFLQPEQMIEEFDPRLLAEIGRLFLKHSELSASQGLPQDAQRSFALAVQCLRDGLGEPLSHTEGDSNDLMRELLRSDKTLSVMTPAEMADTWRDIFEIEARRQNYALAENALFHAIDLADAPEDHVRRGMRFYEVLLKLLDEVLEEGGLGRDEAEMALAELRER
ncbi:MAG: DUF6483 family protein [Persicimonas sp.]